jgi:ribosomal protein L40E
MTDLAPSDTSATRSCGECGAQNPIDADRCSRCGAALPLRIGRDDEREDLEVVEVARAVGQEGYDTEFVAEGDGVRCSACNAGFTLEDARIASMTPAQDTTSGAQPMVVVTGTCPSCGAHGHAVVAADASPELSPRDT